MSSSYSSLSGKYGVYFEYLKNISKQINREVRVLPTETKAKKVRLILDKDSNDP